MIKFKRQFEKRLKTKEEVKKIMKLLRIGIRKKLEEFGLKHIGNSKVNKILLQ